MRHGKKVNHLGRKSAHRQAMLSNMACSLIEHKRITTTLAKAKALRVYVEPIITKSKDDTTHARRTAFSYLKSKEAVSELFRAIAPKVADRPGGYTRIIRTGYRLGDNAEMCLIELVDFNEVYTAGEAKKTTRRSRRGGAKKADTAAAPAAEVETTEAPAETPEAEADTTPEADAPATDNEETAIEE
jgi:large subunit ribosomal protein L17